LPAITSVRRAEQARALLHERVVRRAGGRFRHRQLFPLATLDLEALDPIDRS
jgi:hypothetical protein